MTLVIQAYDCPLDAGERMLDHVLNELRTEWKYHIVAVCSAGDYTFGRTILQRERNTIKYGHTYGSRKAPPPYDPKNPNNFYQWYSEERLGRAGLFKNRYPNSAELRLTEIKHLSRGRFVDKYPVHESRTPTFKWAIALDWDALITFYDTLNKILDRLPFPTMAWNWIPRKLVIRLENKARKRFDYHFDPDGKVILNLGTPDQFEE